MKLARLHQHCCTCIVDRSHIRALSFRRLRFIAINSADMLCVDPSGGTNWRAGNTVYFAVGEGPLLRITDLPAFDLAAFRAVDSDQVAGPELADDGCFHRRTRAHIQEAIRRAQNDGAAAGGCVCGPAQCERDDGGGDECFIASPCRLKREPNRLSRP